VSASELQERSSVSDSRRSFLLGSAGLALAAAASRPLGLLAAEPIPRPGEPFFKFSLAAYSYRSLLTGERPELTLDDFIRDCAALDLAGAELTSYYFPPEPTDEYLIGLKKRCFDLGLDVSGTAIRGDFGVQGEAALQKEIQDVKTWIDRAAVLGAPAIRIFAGHVPKGADPAAVHTQMVAAIDECCRHAGGVGIYLALENHGGPTATAEGLLSLLRDVKSPWLAANLDTGNFHSDRIYEEIAEIAPYAVNVQVKVVVSGPSGKKEPTDYARIAKILRDSGYRGYVVLEFEEAGDPRKEVPRHLDELRAAFA
jgi:sugar phosphate isomerase/epimerase